MSYFVVSIGGVDVTEYLVRPHLRVIREIAGAISTASMVFRAEDRDDGFRLDYSELDIVPLDLSRPDPSGNSLVVIEDGASNVLFRGRIKTLDRIPLSTSYWEYRIDCQGIEADLDRIEVDTQYTAKTDREMIQAAFASNVLGITTLDATVESTLAAVDFDARGMTARRLLDELVNLTGCDWYIDHETLALHWYIPDTASLPATPFDISDDPDNVTTFAARELKPAAEDWFNFANRVTIKGAVKADGTRYTATVETPGLLDADAYPWTVTDDSLTSQALVDARADYELAVRSTLAQQGTFEIERDGLLPGQVIHVTVAARAIDADYQIRRVEIREDYALQQLTYKVDFGLFVASYYDQQRVIRRVTSPTGRVDIISTAQLNGVIEAGGNVTVNTNALFGVILADEVADGVIDALEKFSLALRPIPILASDPTLPDDAYPEGAVYLRSSDSQYRKVVSGAWADATESEALTGKTEFVNVGTLNVSQLNGLILASQIDTLNVDQLNGLIQSSQIEEVAVEKLFGEINTSGDVTINGGTVVLNSLPGSAIIGLAVSKLTADNANFTGTASFGYGSGSTNRLTITSLAIKIEGGSGNYFQADGGQVIMSQSGRTVAITSLGIVLTNSGSVATLSSSSLKFTQGTANTEVSAGGVQIWGGTTGIGIGASSFASSPLQITASAIAMVQGSSTFDVNSTFVRMFFGGSGVLVSSGQTALGSALTSVTGTLSCGTVNSTGVITTTGSKIHINSVGGRLEIDGVQVLTAQQTAVADATGAGDIVAQFNTLLSRLRAHGIIAT